MPSSSEAGGNQRLAVNLVVNPTNPRFEGDLELCIKHKVELVYIKRAPNEVFKKLSLQVFAFHDVAFKRHAEKAQRRCRRHHCCLRWCRWTHGSGNPFALVNEIREITNKPIIFAGGLSTVMMWR